MKQVKLSTILLVLHVLLPGLASANIISDYRYGHQGWGTGGPHALTSADGQSYCYDANGDMTAITPGACSSISLDRQTQETRHVYSVSRKLKTVSSDAGEIRYLYTATGEKIAVLHELESRASRTELFSDSGVRFTNNQPRMTYGGNAEISEDGQELHFFIKDHLGSILATVARTGVLERKDQLPYGEKWFSDSYAATDRDFNGNFKEGQLLDYNARHYLPEIGKFIQTDSIIPRQTSLGWNRYAYVSNNPINRIDPSGHWDVPGYGKWNIFEGSSGNGFFGFVGAMAGGMVNAVNNAAGSVLDAVFYEPGVRAVVDISCIPGDYLGEENLDAIDFALDQIHPSLALVFLGIPQDSRRLLQAADAVTPGGGDASARAARMAKNRHRLDRALGKASTHTSPQVADAVEKAGRSPHTVDLQKVNAKKVGSWNGAEKRKLAEGLTLIEKSGPQGLFHHTGLKYAGANENAPAHFRLSFDKRVYFVVDDSNNAVIPIRWGDHDNKQALATAKAMGY